MMWQSHGSLVRKYFVGLLIVGCCLLTTGSSQAVSLVWDPAANGSGSGGIGNWNVTATSLANWFNGSADIAWDAVTYDGAVFGGTGGAVTIVSDAGAGVSAKNLTFNVGGYSIGGDKITLTGTPVITVTNLSDTATINSIVSGSNGLTKSGSGTLTLSASDNYTGGTTINSGTLKITNAAGLGAATEAVAVNSTGQLWLSVVSGGANTDATYNANAISGAGTLKITAPNSNWATAIVPGNLSGFTGTIDILPYGANGGKTRFSGASGFQPSSSATVKIESGATLYLNQALTYANSFELYGNGNVENLVRCVWIPVRM